MKQVLKKCPKCGIRKNIEEFWKNKSTTDGLYCYCKDCGNILGKEYCQNNKKKIGKRNKKYYCENKKKIIKQSMSNWRQDKEKVSKQHKEYRHKNKEKFDNYNKQYWVQNREKISKQVKKYRQENPKKVHEQDKKYNEKRRLNLQYRLSNNVSRAIRRSLENGKNGIHWEDIMNFALQDLVQDMEFKFIDGMAWKNYGLWHIHHKIPVSLWKFSSYEDHEFKQCWALCNLQPMWAKDNLSKGNKVL